MKTLFLVAACGALLVDLRSQALLPASGVSVGRSGPYLDYPAVNDRHEIRADEACSGSARSTCRLPRLGGDGSHPEAIQFQVAGGIGPVIRMQVVMIVSWPRADL